MISDFPAPITRKMFPFDDFIMRWILIANGSLMRSCAVFFAVSWRNYWTNNRAADNPWYHDSHVMSLQWYIIIFILSKCFDTKCDLIMTHAYLRICPHHRESCRAIPCGLCTLIEHGLATCLHSVTDMPFATPHVVPGIYGARVLSASMVLITEDKLKSRP